MLLDTHPWALYDMSMVVNLTPDQESLLSRLAERTGKDAEQVVQETVTRLLENEANFIKAVEQGFASLDRGEYVEHEEVGTRIERLFS